MATKVTGQDPLSTVEYRATEFGDQRVSAPMILLGDSFDVGTLDTQRWTETTASGGSVTVAGDGKCRLSTSVDTAGSAEIESDDEFSPPIGMEIWMRAFVRFPDDAVADNTRAIGLQDDAGNNKYYLELSGTTLSVKVDSGGSTVESTSTNAINPDDNGYFQVEIYASKDHVRFVINGAHVDSYGIHTNRADLTDELIQSTIFKVFASNTNSGNNTNVSMDIAQIGLWLVGDIGAWGPVRSVRKNAASSSTLVRGCGLLERVWWAATAGQVFSIYDNDAAGSGRLIFRKASLVSNLEGPWLFANGLYFSHTSGSADDVFFLIRGA